LSNVSQHCKFCILYFGVWRYDRWLQLLKNIFKICRHSDMQKAFLVGRSKYLPASPLVDLIVSCKSREFADSHYNLVKCFSSNTFGRCIRVFLREAYFVIHSTKLRLYVVKNLCRLDTALEALWSRLKWLWLIWEPQLTLIEKHQWKLCTMKFLKALIFYAIYPFWFKICPKSCLFIPLSLVCIMKDLTALISSSYGTIVYWFLHFMFLVWHSFLWKRI
jgi:hypothetical protein